MKKSPFDHNSETLPRYQGMEKNAWCRFWMKGGIPIGPGWPVSSEIQWCLGDSEKEYYRTGNRNYSPESVSYKFNSRGYRSMDIDLKNPSPNKKIAFIGCSITQGVGVPWEELWTTRLTEMLSAHYGEEFEQHNFGYGGTGNDMMAMIAYQIVPVIKPDLLVVLFANPARRMHFSDYTTRNHLLPNTSEGVPSNLYEAYLQLQTDANDWYDFVRQFSMIDMTAKINNVPWVWNSWFPLPENANLYLDMHDKVSDDFPHPSTWDRARDNRHPGKRTNQEIADQYMKKIIQVNPWND